MNYSLWCRPREAFEGINASTKNKAIRRKYSRRVKLFLKENPVTVDNLPEILTDKKYQTLLADIIKAKAGGLFDLSVTQDSISGKDIQIKQTSKGYTITCFSHAFILEEIFKYLLPDCNITRYGITFEISVPKSEEQESEIDSLRKRVKELEDIIANINKLSTI